MLVPGTPTYERISVGEQVSDKDLETLENSRLQALKFVDLSSTFTDLGTTYLIRAQRASSDDDRQSYVEMAIEVTTKGLNLAPLNTFAWLRLSSAHILLGPDPSFSSGCCLADLAENGKMSMEEPDGFEPSRALPPNTLSRRAP